MAAEGSLQSPPEESGSSSRARDYFDELKGTFDDAAALSGQVDRSFVVAGKRVVVRFAGEALASPMTAALAHLAETSAPLPGNADLTIHAWDSATTGTTMPPPLWTQEQHGPRGEISGFEPGPVRLSFQVGPNALSVIDLERRSALYWIRDAAALPYYEAGAPFRSIFHSWAEASGLQLVHGAAVGAHARAVLIAARGGSGKSTTAISCALGGLSYLGDDYCLVGLSPPRVYSLYSSAKVNAADVGRFRKLEACLSNRARLDNEKALFFLERCIPEQIIPQAELCSVLVPRISGQAETSWTPAGPGAGLRAIGPSTIFQQAGAGDTSFRFLAELVRQVPTRFLDLGSRLDGIAPVIRTLLETHA